MTTREVIAVSWVGSAPPASWESACGELGPDAVRHTTYGDGTALCVQGSSPRQDDVVGLTLGARWGDRDVTSEDLRHWTDSSDRPEALDQVLPPCAFVGVGSRRDTLRAGGDFMGFRSLYTAAGDGWAAISTSTAALATLVGRATDMTSLAAYSLIGWRIGDRTHFEGVSTLPAGAWATLRAGRLEVSGAGADRVHASDDLELSVRQAADCLRTIVSGALDDHGDTWLQLTGGLDSRILLAAIEPERRKHVEAMTLAVPGNPDADLAGALASSHGMRHHIVPVVEPDRLAPSEALALAMEGARRVDYSADPLAWASLAVAERAVDQRPRLSGLGGEVIRGFYYVGPYVPVRTTHRRVHALAKWRLFSNESVPGHVLDPDFAASREVSTLAELERIFDHLPRHWHEATDAFYLHQRMRRWAGVTTSSTCQDRMSINPMLDPRFMAIGRGVGPSSRANMRFLSRILCELDPRLADLPLDGRPPPKVYAQPGLVNRARISSLTAQKARRKVVQRVRSGRRPAAGGVTMAGLILEALRTDPTSVAALGGSPVLAPGVVERILEGEIDPTPATIGFLVTLAAAGELR